MATVWASMYFNPPLLRHLIFKISQVFAPPGSPSSAVAAFLLWLSIYRPSPAKGCPMHCCPSVQVASVFPSFLAAPVPISFTGLFFLWSGPSDQLEGAWEEEVDRIESKLKEVRVNAMGSA